MTTLRAKLGLTALMACLLAVVACAGEPVSRLAAGGETEGFPYPAKEEAVAGPGSPLLDGFVVEDGSWLLGAPFPRHTRVTGDGDEPWHGKEWYGWDAVLALTGDAKTVVEGYLSQASALGFSAGNPSIQCDSEGRCVGELHKQSGESGANERITFSVEAARLDEELSGWKSALVELSVHGTGAHEKPRVFSSASRSTALHPDAAAGSLPGPGDVFGGVQFELRGTPVGSKVSFKVEDGSDLVVPALLDVREAQLGPAIVAVLRLDQGASGIFGYTRQAEARYPGNPHKESWELDERVEVTQYASFCPAGCGQFEAITVTWIDGVTYALIRSSTRS